MNSLSAIQRDLMGKTKPQKRRILEQEVSSMNEHEKEKYRRFYEMAHMELRTRKKVGIVIRELDRAGLFSKVRHTFHWNML